MSSLLRFGLSVLLLAIGLHSEVFPQELPPSRQIGTGTRTISGSVLLRGTMVSNVRVTISSAGRTFHRTVYADGAGSFSLSGVPLGQYTVELDAEGYITQRESIDVPPGSGTLMFQFLMRPAPVAVPASSKQALVSVAALNVPKDAQEELIAGQRAMERRRWTEARQHFEKALKKHAAFPRALHALALLDVIEQQPERALEHLRQAVEVDASYAEAYVESSRLLNSLGKPEEALPTAQKAIALRPDLWQAQYELGVAALSLGRDALALEASKAISLAGGPAIVEARLLRAGVFLHGGRYADAKAELEEFLRLAPTHVHAPLARKTLEGIVGREGTPGRR